MARVFREKRHSGRVKTFIFIVVCIAAVIFIWTFAGNLSADSNDEQIKMNEEAVLRATVQCYAIEGMYPPSLKYLADNYGLTLNEDKYIYYFHSIGENMVPEIKVMAR